MPDIISFILIISLAMLIVFGLHVLKEKRNELRIRQRVTALEEKVFNVHVAVEPEVPKPLESPHALESRR